MSATLDAYAPFVGAATIDELRLLGEKLRGRRVQNVNSTAVGGGVAEILHRMIPLLGELGVDARWDVIRGGDAFYAVTKAIHNGLHGEPVTLGEQEVALFLRRRTTSGSSSSRTTSCSSTIRSRSASSRGAPPARGGSGAVTSTCRRRRRRCGTSSTRGWSATTRRSSRRRSSPARSGSRSS